MADEDGECKDLADAMDRLNAKADEAAAGMLSELRDFPDPEIKPSGESADRGDTT